MSVLVVRSGLGEIKEILLAYFGVDVILEHFPVGIEKVLENLSRDIWWQNPKFEPVSFGNKVRLSQLRPICA
jgi:hypothetical protein